MSATEHAARMIRAFRQSPATQRTPAEVAEDMSAYLEHAPSRDRTEERVLQLSAGGGRTSSTRDDEADALAAHRTPPGHGAATLLWISRDLSPPGARLESEIKGDAMNCTHHMWDEPNGPVCTRSDPHDAGASGGHVYESCDGSCTNPSESVASSHRAG